MTHRAWIAVALVLVVSALVPMGGSAWAQEAGQATLTVLDGEVAIVRADGSAVQPAQSGTVVGVGDEIRTLTASGALLTFFDLNEIEMGADSALRIETLTPVDDRLDISLKQTLGVTFHRVRALKASASTYRVDAGGAITQATGGEVVIYGPTDENMVVLVCGSHCGEGTTFAGTPVSSETGYFVQVDHESIASDVAAFNPGDEVGPWNAAYAGATEAVEATDDDDEHHEERRSHRSHEPKDETQESDPLTPVTPTPIRIGSPIARPGTPIGTPSASSSSPSMALIMVLGSMSFGATMLFQRGSTVGDSGL